MRALHGRGWNEVQKDQFKIKRQHRQIDHNVT